MKKILSATLLVFLFSCNSAAKAGSYHVQITNAAGQTVSRKELQVNETDFKQLASLQKGIYYVKITELSSNASCIQQIVVQ